jgi:hypothetical protein
MLSTGLAYHAQIHDIQATPSCHRLTEQLRGLQIRGRRSIQVMHGDLAPSAGQRLTSAAHVPVPQPLCGSGCVVQVGVKRHFCPFLLLIV